VTPDWPSLGALLGRRSAHLRPQAICRLGLLQLVPAPGRARREREAGAAARYGRRPPERKQVVFGAGLCMLLVLKLASLVRRCEDSRSVGRTRESLTESPPRLLVSVGSRHLATSRRACDFGRGQLEGEVSPGVRSTKQRCRSYRSSFRSLSGSRIRSMVVIRPCTTVKPTTPSVPAGVCATRPAAPLTSAGRQNGANCGPVVTEY
jgi:hypothetical protein